MNKLIAILFIFTFPISGYEDPPTDITTSQNFNILHQDFVSYKVEPDPFITRFFIVQHGQSEANLLNLIDGRTLNLPLTEKGLSEACQTAEHIHSKINKIDVVISSPMLRTMVAAQKIIELFKDEPTVIFLDNRLIERYLGVFEGKSEIEYLPYKFIELDKFTPFEERFKFKAHPSIESFKDLYTRMSDCLLEYAQKNPGKNIVVVTHEYSIRSLYCMCAAEQYNVYIPQRNFSLIGGLLVIESNGKKLMVKCHNGFKFIF